MLFRNTLLYLPAQIIGPLFQLVSVVVWTHVASEASLGAITLVTATHELLQTVFLVWWSQYALRFFGGFQDEEQADRFYRTENAVLLLSVAVQSVVVLAILRSVIAPDAGIGMAVAVVGYVVSRTYNLYLAERARVRHEIVVYSLQQLTGPVVGFLLGLFFIRMFGPDPEWPVAGFAIAQFVALAAALPLTRFSWKVGPLDRTIMKQAIQYGVPLVIGGGLSWIGINASRFIVSDMMGLSAAGLFAVGYGLGYRASTVAAMMVTASAFPIAVRTMELHGRGPALQQLAENGALLAAILLPSIAGVYMLRDEIVHLLIAPAFQTATLTILPLATLAGAIRNFRAHFADQVFLLCKRTRPMMIVSGIEAALTVGISIVCISKWGLGGAVIASTVAASVAAAISFGVGVGFFGFRLPIGHLARIALATLAMVLVLHAVAKSGTAVSLVVHVSLGAAVYCLVLAACYAPTLRRMFLRRAKSPAPAEV
jgi:O-antigen/teichoic acid export membrane protein